MPSLRGLYVATAATWPGQCWSCGPKGTTTAGGTATVAYGIAALVVPIFLVLAALPFPDEGSVVEALGVVSSVLIMIWPARSAHDLAAPRHQPATQTRLGA